MSKINQMRIVLLSVVLALTTLSTAWYRNRRSRRVEPFQRSPVRPIQYRIHMRVFPTYIETMRVWNDQDPERQVVPLRHRRRSCRVSMYLIDLNGYAVNTDPRHPALRTFLGLIELHFRACPPSVLELRYDTLDWNAQARVAYSA